MEKILQKFIYNEYKNKDIKGFKFFIRFIFIPLLISPILYPYMVINKRKFNKKFVDKFMKQVVLREWLTMYKFKLFDNRFVKTDTITINNPMYHNTDKENEIIINEDVSSALHKKLLQIDDKELMGMIKVDTFVSTEFVSELDLYNQIYDKKDKLDIVEDLLKLKNFENEAELYEYLIKTDIKNIKIIIFTTTIEYKYIKLIRNLAIYCMINICFLITIVLFLLFNK